MSAQEAWTVSVFVFGLVFIFSAKRHNTSFHSKPTTTNRPAIANHNSHTNSTTIRKHQHQATLSRRPHTRIKTKRQTPCPTTQTHPIPTHRLRDTACALICAFVCAFLWDRVCGCVCKCVFVCVQVCVCVSVNVNVSERVSVCACVSISV